MRVAKISAIIEAVHGNFEQMRKIYGEEYTDKQLTLIAYTDIINYPENFDNAYIITAVRNLSPEYNITLIPKGACCAT